jgi:catechol 2,3-dioxygenase-like lactoylglutathione lyase family enzyme
VLGFDGREELRELPGDCHGPILLPGEKLATILTEGQDARPITVEIRGSEIMGFAVNHVHLKTRDPAATVRFYQENFGATVKSETPGRGFQLDLHGLQLNVTSLIAEQNHEQHYGIEHIAVNTDDYPGTIAKLKANGVTILEELPRDIGRRVCFLAAPDGAQVEVIEKVRERSA